MKSNTILALAFCSSTLGAQSGAAATDSANVARTAWRAATTAARASDLVTARREAARATAAWPTQEAYQWGRVVLALQASDTAGVVAGLSAYADLGFGRNVSADARFVPFTSAPGLAAALARHDAQRAPIANSAVRATLPDSTYFPEGMDIDTATGKIYVTSVRHGTIAELAPDGKFIREVIRQHTPNVGAILGVRVDGARGVLWAVTSGIPQLAGYKPADSAIAALVRIRTRDGVIEQRWDLPAAAAGHTLGDVVLGPKGDVFFTDSREPVFYRLRPGSTALDKLQHPLFRSLQGMAPTPDGATVYVADWTHGLLRVTLATGAVVRVADAPKSVSLGIDGIALHRGAIVAVQNGAVPPRVARFTLNARGDSITRVDVLDRNVALADEPTIGAIYRNEFVYVANSQWNKYSDAGALLPNARLARPVLLSVPLSPNR